MTPTTRNPRRIATRLGLVGGGLLLAATGTVAAHGYGGGMMGGGMMGGSWGGTAGGGLLGGGMLLWPLLLLALVLFVGFGLARGGRGDRALDELRARYARGDLSTEEFDSRRDTLERTA